MASPASRSELKDYCLRKLGFPVIDINVDDDQLEDRIDDALQKFKDYHYDGTEEIYLAHQVTAGDISNTYVTLSDNINGITRVLPVSAGSLSSTNSQGFNIFDINYQIRLNDFYNLLSSSYTYYVIAREHLSMLDLIVTGEVPFSYNKKVNQVKIFMDWTGRVSAGDYIVFQASRIVDPDTYSKVFNDSFLKTYTTALFKMQWGNNLSKYTNYTLPGGLVVNGEKIYNDAVAEVELLHTKLREEYELPPQMLVG
mgnify:CR=1 FL=1|jgi:hypothetical protein